MNILFSKKGFTLIELLVVIGILAVLAAIAIPSIAGLIDRANISADQTTAKEMTNAIERFTSEYELVKQDISSGKFDTNNLDSTQSRIYNVFKIKTLEQIVHLENQDGFNGYGLNINTKYPKNEKTFKDVIMNYLKTSSTTFIPKQSDMAFYYSPEIGMVIVAEDGSTTSELNAIALVDEDGVSLSNIKTHITLDAEIMPLADDVEENNIQWINVSLNEERILKGEIPSNEYVATNTKSIYTSLRNDISDYWELTDSTGGIYTTLGGSYAKIEVNGEMVNANWTNLIKGDYIRIEDGLLSNGSRVRELQGVLVIDKNVSSLVSGSYGSSNSAFANSGITTLVIDEGVSALGTYAFNYCSELTTVYIPASLHTISSTSFSYCSKMEKFVVNDKNTYFYDIDGVLYSYSGALVKYPTQNATEFVVPEGIKQINFFAFDHNYRIRKITLPTTLEFIKNQAFDGCNYLNDVYINSNCEVGLLSFRNADNLTIHLNNNDKYVFEDGILYTSNYKTLVAATQILDFTCKIKEGVEIIENGAFNTSRVKTLYLPQTIKRIKQNNVFDSLETIYYEGNEERFNMITVNSITNDTTLTNFKKANVIYNYQY